MEFGHSPNQTDTPCHAPQAARRMEQLGRIPAWLLLVDRVPPHRMDKKKRKTNPAKMNTGDYIYKSIFAQHTIRPILISIHCKTTYGTSYYSALPTS